LKIIFGSFGAVVLILVIFLAYSQYKLYTLSRDEKVVTDESRVVTASTTPEDIVSMLGKHILLPQGNPQIAEVKDIEKLRNQQAFFKDAQNDDIVFVYETMIYIYRPSTDIVIAVSDISGVGQAKP
jgi:hypothetical protein